MENLIKKIYGSFSDKQTSVIEHAFLYLKLKQLSVLEDVDERNSELQETHFVEINDLLGLGWVYDRMASMSADLHKDLARANCEQVRVCVDF